MNRRSSASTLVCLVAMLTLATVAAGAVGEGAVDTTHGVAADTNWSSNEDVLTVASDGSGDYESIQAAVDAARDGDTVRVRPGTYRESVTVDENVTLIAPRGATLDGSTLDDATAIEVEGTAAIDLSGFVIVNYNSGITMAVAKGDWEISNVTIENSDYQGIDVDATDGDWRIRNVTIRDGEGGIRAGSTSGDWRIEDTVVRNVSLSDGIYARFSTGDWTVTNVTVDDPTMVGLDASTSTGDWRVVNSTFRDAAVGIGAFETSGNWTVSRSTVANISTTWRVRFVKPPHEEGVGVFATGSNGTWTLRGNRFVDNEVGDVVADDADPAGDARQNLWGDAAGADGDVCTGNVDCSNALESWPPERSLALPSTPTVSAASGTETPSSDGNATTATGTADDATRTETTATATDGPLSPLLGVFGLVFGALLAARRVRAHR